MMENSGVNAEENDMKDGVVAGRSVVIGDDMSLSFYLSLNSISRSSKFNEMTIGDTRYSREMYLI